jgi:DNA-binding NtrC family response regulator
VGFDAPTLAFCGSHLAGRGVTTKNATSLARARELLRTSSPAFCIVDAELASGEAFRVVEFARDAHVPVALIGGAATEDWGDELGHFLHLDKPLGAAALERIVACFESRLIEEHGRPLIVGESPIMKRLQQMLRRISTSDATVLLIGESGTGKELVATTIHALSRRAQGPFLALNCGAMTPTLIESELFGHERGSFTGAVRRHNGYFERAHGGTLFLDEITEMPLELQVRLLRVLETRVVSRVGSAATIPVDVRVIAATNRDPQEAVRQRTLREDLWYRLQVVPIYVPPLRTRPGDVRILAEHFLAELNRAHGTDKTFTDAALQRLEDYRWPGNVRELCNAVQRAYILSDQRVIGPSGIQIEAAEDSKSHVFVRFRVGDSLATVEQRLIEQTLQCCRTKDEAARMLGVSNKTLYNKLRRYHQRAQPTVDEQRSPPVSVN